MADVHFSALSDRWVSAENNDAFCTEKIGKYYVFGVAEGLTDLPGGSSASGIAIASVKEAVKGNKRSPPEILTAAVRMSEARITAHAEPPGVSPGSTHLSACLLEDSLDCTILDTGEGNAYLIGPEGIRIPRDLPVSGKPGSQGLPLRNPVEDKQRTDLISHTLGEPHMLKMSDFVSINMRGRYLILSSGGLHDFVRKERIGEIVLKNGENVETSCELLLQEAQSAGSEKTITLVLIHGHLH